MGLDRSEQRAIFLKRYGVYRDGKCLGADIKNLDDTDLYEYCLLFSGDEDETLWVKATLASRCSNKWGDNRETAKVLNWDTGTVSSYKRVVEVFPPELAIPELAFSSHRKCLKPKLHNELCRAILNEGYKKGKRTVDDFQEWAKTCYTIAKEMGLVGVTPTDDGVDKFLSALQNETVLKIKHAVKAHSLESTVSELVGQLVQQLKEHLNGTGFTLEDISFVGALHLNATFPLALIPEPVTTDDEEGEPEIGEYEVAKFAEALDAMESKEKSKEKKTPKAKSDTGIDTITISTPTNSVTLTDDQFQQAVHRVTGVNSRADDLLGKPRYHEETGELLEA